MPDLTSQRKLELKKRSEQLSAGQRERFQLLVEQSLCEEMPPEFPPRPESGLIPLTPMQRRLWLMDQLQPGARQFNIPMAFELEGRLYPMELRESLAEMIQRHESLRTVIVTQHGQGFQQVLPELAPPFVHSSRDEGDWPAICAQEVRNLIRNSFALAKGPLFRFELVSFGATRHLILLNFHHIIFDGWSANLFFQELLGFYLQKVYARRFTPPDQRAQYADYALLLAERSKNDPGMQQQREYWVQLLQGEIPRLQLPFDFPRSNLRAAEGGNLRLILKTLDRKTLIAALGPGVTPYQFFLACFSLLLHYYGMQEELVFGAVSANRRDVTNSKIIGFFANLLPMRIRIWQSDRFCDLLHRVKDQSIAFMKNDEVSFDEVPIGKTTARETSRMPLFDALFVMQEAQSRALQAVEAQKFGLKISPLAVEQDQVQFDLTWSMHELEGIFQVHLEFNRNLFLPQTMERMWDDFQTLAQRFLADQELSLASFALGSPPIFPLPVRKPSMAHMRISEKAAETPEATALDLLRYVATAGYLSNVATVLHELAEACDAGRPADPLARAQHRAWIEFASVLLGTLWEFNTAPDGQTLKDRISATSYYDRSFVLACKCVPGFALGENLARGQKTPKEVVDAWMRSPSHRDAILNPDYADLGIGVSAGYWVQHFGGKLFPGQDIHAKGALEKGEE